MIYKKIKPKKIYEEVAETIYEMIRTGELKPGQKLDSVQQLASNFQVGRSAIREALTALSAMGLVEMRQGEGTYIQEFETDQITFPLSTAILMNKKDVVNLLEVRKIIEVGSAKVAARKRSDLQLAVIEKALDMMKNAPNEEIGEEADLQFHLAIAEAAQNPLLFSLMNHVSGLMEVTLKETRRVWVYSKQTTVEQLYNEHLAIYEAIKDQNDEMASHFMLVHLQNIEAILEKYFQQTNIKK
ncbi:FadR/GntR family transcriptional regulator [Neobacillus sp. PS3-40]|uniref:FadR/GntR family transcriptional regulator n=1 Tax=Neobacillus sp. PS3-40 TaxID=3070679 RepID=UPI0027E1FC46|nr:FadR/GntR family transcriptional regulator [Neobacillus sp. PS3-40]WML43491.1 FadR/GntR family transcriptional regulator [Neobacillus sp. PS3-40]